MQPRSWSLLMIACIAIVLTGAIVHAVPAVTRINGALQIDSQTATGCPLGRSCLWNNSGEPTWRNSGGADTGLGGTETLQDAYDNGGAGSSQLIQLSTANGNLELRGISGGGNALIQEWKTASGATSIAQLSRVGLFRINDSSGVLQFRIDGAHGVTLENDSITTSVSTLGMILQNTALSTNVAQTHNSPVLQLSGTYWDGEASTTDTWTLVANAGNTTKGLSFGNSGTGDVLYLTQDAGIADTILHSPNTWNLKLTSGATNGQTSDNAAIIFDTVNSQTSGNLLAVENHGTQKLWVDYHGSAVSLTGLYAAVVKGGNLTSASTITPTSSIHHVTGTATISTIATSSLPAGFVGCVDVIPDAAATYTTGGNIAKASTLVVGLVNHTCFDGTSWYPSY